MIPIRNMQGSVIGFGGRILHEEQNMAKYINSPQTLLYDKGRVLFGLDVAKQEIRARDAVIIVEGYMDFFAVYACGMKNVVASSGTALTTDQIRLISRFTKNILFSFDMDAAGTKATLRGIENALAEGMNVKIIRLPRENDGSKKYKDPDECIRADRNAWEESVSSAVSFMEYYFDTLLTPNVLTDAFEKRRYARQILQSIRLLPDRIEQDHWIRALGTRIGISESLLWEELTAIPHTSTAQAVQPQQPEKKANPSLPIPYDVREELLLALLFKKPDLVFKIASIIPSYMIRSAEQRAGYEELYTLSETIKETPEMIHEMVERTCTGDRVDRLRLLADKEWSESSPIDLERTAQAFSTFLRAAYLRSEITRLQGRMRDAEQRGDRSAMEEYAKQFQNLQNM